MYVTSANECYALDAGNGREIWRFQRPRTKGLVGNAAGGINRGVAVAGDRLFMVTDHAHLIALNRFTGELLWDTEMADWRQNYNATAAPLIVGDLVIAGHGRRRAGRARISRRLRSGNRQGGVAILDRARSPASRDRKRGLGSGIEHPGGVTWMTGVYDPELQLVYWTTGNPSPDYNGDDRLGDNLYASSVVALDARTGQLKWHFQFTPHNVWDWDAQQPTVLVDTTWEGRPRKLLVQASRNGFFYVLDRTDGKFLLRQAVREKSDVGERDRTPMAVRSWYPDRCRHPKARASARRRMAPPTGTRRRTVRRPASITCRRSRTATSSSRAVSEWVAGKSYWGGSTRQAPDAPNQKILRAIDVKTGKVAWELPQPGPGAARGGTLVTASGLLVLLRRSGSIRGRRRVIGKAAVAVRHEQRLARVADDLRVRRAAARRDRVGVEHHCVRAGEVDQTGEARVEDVSLCIAPASVD